jgi:hypothetical protein
VRDVIDVATTFEYLVAVGPTVEIRVRSVNAVDVEVGEPCALAVLADAVTVWPSATFERATSSELDDSVAANPAT